MALNLCLNLSSWDVALLATVVTVASAKAEEVVLVLLPHRPWGAAGPELHRHVPVTEGLCSIECRSRRMSILVRVFIVRGLEGSKPVTMTATWQDRSPRKRHSSGATSVRLASQQVSVRSPSPTTVDSTVPTLDRSNEARRTSPLESSCNWLVHLRPMLQRLLRISAKQRSISLGGLSRPIADVRRAADPKLSEGNSRINYTPAISLPTRSQT